MHWGLDLKDNTLSQGHDTQLSHGKNCVKYKSHVLEKSRSSMVVRSYGLDRDFGYMFTVTLTLEI